jgi:hypothetical protein
MRWVKRDTKRLRREEEEEEVEVGKRRCSRGINSGIRNSEKSPIPGVCRPPTFDFQTVIPTTASVNMSMWT